MALPSLEMADQLSFHLDPALPRLPAMLAPMLAQTASEPFDSPDHLFEPNWGGTRVLLFVDAAESGDPPAIRILAEGGRNVAPLLPELRGLRDHVASESAVLDGELVVVDRLGRADPLALASRLRGMPGASVAFLVFDILYRDGRPLLNQPLERRRQLLRKVLRPGDQAIAVPSLAGEGRALFAAVTEVGIAGVMARLGRSPYLPGVRSRMWRFVPCRGGSIGPTAGVPDVPVASAEQQDNSRPSAPVLALIRRLPMGDMEA